MNATLKSLRLLNFKGVRNFFVEFNSDETNIHGANASGKTTLYDAFFFLLFGKDSTGKSDFNIKTLNDDGTVIERIPHEVEGVILINSKAGIQEATLKRVYEEKWTKKRGSAIEEFTGHETTLFFNDVPCSAKEFQAKIEVICPETIFKFITNPFYFPSQKKETQRAMLFDLAGGIDETEIARGNSDYEALLSQLVGKTLDDYKKEIASKKSKIKDELKGMPERMDECRRGKKEVQDWDLLAAQLKTKLDSISKIEEQMLDRSKGTKDAQDKKVEAQKELGELKIELANIEFKIKETLLTSIREYNAKHKSLTDSIKSQKESIEALKKIHEEWVKRSATTDEKLTKLRGEYTIINAETLVFAPGAFDCPTCKRAFDVNDIEAKQAEMTTTFNTQKVNKIEDNKKAGLATKAELEEINKSKDRTKLDVEKSEQALKALELELNTLTANPPQEPNFEEAFSANQEHVDAKTKIKAKEGLINAPVEEVDNTDLIESKKTLQLVVDDLRAKLAHKKTNEDIDKRIVELETSYTTLSNELASYEQVEFTITQFTKAKVAQVEDKINGMFSIVKFNLYEMQINGGEKEICEASVNGVPFSDLNNAMRINAGLDIIKTLCKKYDYYAPIFIDNRESVTEIIDMDSQIINLIVDKTAHSLTIK